MNKAVAFALLFYVCSFGIVNNDLAIAIDQGNMLLADSLVNKVKVESDIYCPAEMDVNQAKLVYKNHLEKNPFVFLDNCDSTFIKKYVSDACLDKSGVEMAVCREWASRHPDDMGAFAERFCSNRGLQDLCGISLEYVPADQLMKFINMLDKSESLRYVEHEEYDTVYTKVVADVECMNKWDLEIEKYRKEIYTRKNAAGVNRFLGISVYSYYTTNQCNLPSSSPFLKDSLAKCFNMVTKFVEEKRKAECFETRSFDEKKIRETAVYPYRSQVVRARDYLTNRPWYEMNGEWLENMELMNRYEPMMFDIGGRLRAGEKVPVDWAVATCLMNLGYNVQVADSLRGAYPSCNEIKNLYKVGCRSEGEVIDRPVYLGNDEIRKGFVCTKGEWKPYENGAPFAASEQDSWYTRQ